MKGKTDLVQRKADPASSTCIYQQAHRLCANSLQYMDGSCYGVMLL
jgi:hypothetical protein